MFYPRFATRLCAFSLLWLGFAATPALAEAPLSPTFQPLPAPIPVPALIVQDLTGREMTLAALIRKKKETTPTLVLHLWAPSCGPCQPEMRELDAALPRLTAQGIGVIALAQDPDGSVTVPAFARRYGIKNLPLYIDRARTALMRLPPHGTPTSYLIGDKGEIIAKKEGGLDWSEASVR